MWIGSGSDSATSAEVMTLRAGALGRFADDERGSYTLWSIIWFMLYAALGGVAVDVTDAYRNQTLLQSTADASALAAIMSVGKPGGEPVRAANYYGTANMKSEVNGDVLLDSDITLGNYDLGTDTFTAGATPTNAVHVVTRRAVENGNPVGMNFLRILGLFGLNPIWNVAAEAIAVGDVSTCHNNGLIAGGVVEQSQGNNFYENICVHGVGGLQLTESNYFESGVATGTTCFDCVGPSGNNPSDNEGWDEAWWRGGENDALYPLNASMVNNYITALRNLSKTGDYETMLSQYGTNYAGWRYLFKDDGTAPDLQTVSSLPATLVPNTVYVVDCNGQMALPETTIRNVGIVATCRIHTPSSYTNLDMADTVIAVDGDFAQAGISIAGNGKIGHSNCKWGAVELYTSGSNIKFAAGGDVNNVRLISAESIHWSAQTVGRVGVMAEALGDIKITSKSDFGLCENRVVNGPNQYTYRLEL